MDSGSLVHECRYASVEHGLRLLSLDTITVRVQYGAMTIVESCRFIPGSPDILRARASARHFDLHMHDTFSVVVLMEGSASLRSNRWSKRAQAGDVFFFNPFEVHSGGSLDQPARYEVLYPSRRFVLDCLPAGEFRYSLPLVRTDVLRRCATTGAFVDGLSTTNPGAETVETALRKLLQSCAFEPAGFAESGISAVRAACQFINERYMCAIGTDMLANRVGLHKSHFVGYSTAQPASHRKPMSGRCASRRRGN